MMKMKFLDVFSEDEKENLVLQVKIQVKEQDFNVGDQFRKNDKIAGVDFHGFRYFDFAVEQIEEGFYRIIGVFPQK